MARTRSIANALSRLLSASPRPIYALDEQRTIVFCNQACEQWAGVEAAQIVGLRCDYGPPGEPANATGAASPADATSPADAASIAAGLCPPPEAFLPGQTPVTVACLSRTGVSRREAVCFSLAVDEFECVGVVVVVDHQDADVQPRGVAPDPIGESDSGQLHDRLRTIRLETARRYQLDCLVGDSPAMRRVRAQVRVAAESQVPCVIVGPPGSGRERIARAIHFSGTRVEALPLIPIDCSLLDAEMLHSTVMAYVQQRYQLEREHLPAMLMLDVDQLAADAQLELSAMLQLPEVGLHTVCTARRSLFDLAEHGHFSAELAHSLSTIVLEVPALEHRQEDIPLLVQWFLEQENVGKQKQLSGFEPEAMDQLVTHPWLGQVEELRGVVAKACRAASGPLVTVDDLPTLLASAATVVAHPKDDETIVLDDFLAEVERELIRRALKKTKGNKSQASTLLGISRPRLLRRISQLGLES